MKNARIRIVTDQLRFDSTIKVIAAESLHARLNLGRALTRYSPLDVLKDDLALQTFTFDNILKLSENMRILRGPVFHSHLSRWIWPEGVLSWPIRQDSLWLKQLFGRFSIWWRITPRQWNRRNRWGWDEYEDDFLDKDQIGSCLWFLYEIDMGNQ
jgi:hypothetical protein